MYLQSNEYKIKCLKTQKYNQKHNWRLSKTCFALLKNIETSGYYKTLDKTTMTQLPMF